MKISGEGKKRRIPICAAGIGPSIASCDAGIWRWPRCLILFGGNWKLEIGNWYLLWTLQLSPVSFRGSVVWGFLWVPGIHWGVGEENGRDSNAIISGKSMVCQIIQIIQTKDKRRKLVLVLDMCQPPTYLLGTRESRKS